LFTLGQAELARTLFPLGAMTKTEVRARARALGLANADKPESQEICFVPDGDYARFVERLAPESSIRAGHITDGEGNVLADHAGIHRFTVGQRRGLGIAAGAPFYVREIRPASGEVVVGNRGELNSRGLIARDVDLVDAATFDAASEVEVKIRYRHPALPARLNFSSPRSAEVRFLSAGPAVTPGQACVFYRGDEVVGGGFIERAIRE
jgi:tRNA-specific 2-thiouridylase